MRVAIVGCGKQGIGAHGRAWLALRERGVDLVAIQQLLGHWTVSSTMRYVRPSATFIEDAYRRAVTATLSELTGEEGSA